MLHLTRLSGDGKRNTEGRHRSKERGKRKEKNPNILEKTGGGIIAEGEI